ncbi:hypothetical protein WJX73_008398 [Symbiochloris irregularis]|uniref:Uncharacterized protein n=1 Tax=Symbiochloris irregularis TaxID=706552 RepID=A0AAW1NKA6_9CHLO
MIDDLQTISTQPLEFIQQLFYTNQEVNGVRGIYPPNSIPLKLCNPGAGFKADFLDITIRPALSTRGPLTTDLYDKRREEGFRQRLVPIKYPAVDTLLSPASKFGVFAGQFIRFCRIIESTANFIVEVANLILVLTRLGHNQQARLTKCRKMILAQDWLLCMGQQRSQDTALNTLFGQIRYRVKNNHLTCDA